jgi:hypothetical protein
MLTREVDSFDLVCWDTDVAEIILPLDLCLSIHRPFDRSTTDQHYSERFLIILNSQIFDHFDLRDIDRLTAR